MTVTNIDKQRVSLKKNVRKFYEATIHCQGGIDCPVKDILTPSLDKWSLLCLYNLGFNGTIRFNKLKSYVPDISSRMLSITLKRLEESGLVLRKVYPEVPPRVEYTLTDFGVGFAERILALNNWVMEYEK